MRNLTTHSCQFVCFALAILALNILPSMAGEPIAGGRYSETMDLKKQGSIDGLDYPCLNLVKFDLDSTLIGSNQTHEREIVLSPNRDLRDGRFLLFERVQSQGMRTVDLLYDKDLHGFNNLVDAQPSSLISIDYTSTAVEMANGGEKIVNLPAVLTIR